MARARSPFTRNGPLLRYPLKKLTNSDDWVKIDVKEYRPGSFSSPNAAFRTTPQGQGGATLASISLPMPWNLPSNNVSTSWEGSNFGAMASLVGDAANKIIGSPENAMDVVQEKMKTIASAATSGLGQQAIETGFTTMVINSIIGGSDVPTSIARFNGIRFNNNVELTFGGVRLRDPFTLMFDMTPRDSSESESIKNIIRTLKYHSTSDDNPSGGAANGAFLKAPDLFQVEYMKGGRRHPYLNLFKLSALTSLSANINPDGYSTYEDGTPVKIQLALTFQELTPIYRRDYAEETNGTTIGY